MKKIQPPTLAEGETYIGIIGDKNGDVYHLILLPGDSAPAPQAKQLDWAKSIGGELPNKLEAMMLFAHAKDQFQDTAYWTGEMFINPKDPEENTWAWCQIFYSGYQDITRKSSARKGDTHRARAIRRQPI